MSLYLTHSEREELPMTELSCYDNSHIKVEVVKINTALNNSSFIYYTRIVHRIHVSFFSCGKCSINCAYLLFPRTPSLVVI